VDRYRDVGGSDGGIEMALVETGAEGVLLCISGSSWGIIPKVFELQPSIRVGGHVPGREVEGYASLKGRHRLPPMSTAQISPIESFQIKT
jgi:hypothetical protein